METDMEKRCDELVRQHVYRNQTALVEMLFEKQLVDYDEVANFHREYSEDELKDEYYDEWLKWRRSSTMREEYDEFVDYLERECNVNWESTHETNEIFSWYLVSDWLEYWLEQLGEPILQSAEYGSWWGRQTFGQMIYMDEIIADVIRAYDEATKPR